MKNSCDIDFIGIGAAKAGTSWLAKALNAHPDICLSAVKETNFFCREHRPRGTSLRYDGSNLDRYAIFYKDCREHQVRGEFSVHYMLESAAADNLQKHFPEAKIIAVLREPVARLISQYRFQRYTLKKDMRSLGDRISQDEGMIRYGMYGALLSEYYRRFPRENIKVIIYEEMRANPLETLREVYSFVGVNDSYVPQELMGKKINATRQVRFRSVMQLVDHVQIAMIRLGIAGWVSEKTKTNVAQFLQRVNFKKLEQEEIDAETKAKIRRLYTEDRRRLEELLGRSLDSVWGAP